MNGFLPSLALPVILFTSQDHEPKPADAIELARTLEGFVVHADGQPAEGAVVTSSAGGRARADAAGRFRLAARVPAGARSLAISASVPGTRDRAQTSVTLDRETSAWAGTLTLGSADACTPSWLATFGGQPGTDQTVLELFVYDDGEVPALFVGGSFRSAGGAAAERIARYDGTSWSALGAGMDGDVRALAALDDGGGPALYAGGDFRNAGGAAAERVARWNGASWSALGAGMNDGVDALAVHDGGGGPALHAAGRFTTAGGAPASRVAKWDGASWSPLGSGMNARVRALCSYDDGTGAALYAAGEFTTAGGSPANRLAKWDGTSWSPLGSGTSQTVLTLAVIDLGSGPELLAGGEFHVVGGVQAIHVARWDGASWSGLTPNVSFDVADMAAFDDGSGPRLHVAGPGTSSSRVARWNGASWSYLDQVEAGGVNALAVFGGALWAGGAFTRVSGEDANRIARWDGATWTPPPGGLNHTVRALAEFDDALHVGGEFTSAGGDALYRFGTWSPGWSSGGGFGEPVHDLAVYDDGGGPALYAGGAFPDGVVGFGVGSLLAGVSGPVFDLEVFDDGSGSSLYVAGDFRLARFDDWSFVVVNRIARWNGTTWYDLAGGMDLNTGTPVVHALAVFDDGNEPALYAGGVFTSAGGVPANRIARWDGASWSALGSGIAGLVFALAVFDDGTGPALYAGGRFSSAGGVPAVGIARWDGASWSAVGGGMNALGDVDALLAFDDGTGPALFAGGKFTTAGGLAVNGIARWDGASWSALGAGVNAGSSVHALAAFNDGTGPALFVGGSFGSAPDSGDSYLAKWGCVDVDPPVIDCPAVVLRGERPGSPPGEIVEFVVTASDARDPSPEVVCMPPSGSFFPHGTTLVTGTATDASGNSATCQFAVQVERTRVRRR